MLRYSKKRSRETRKYKGKDRFVANSPDDRRLYSGNVHHKAWHDAGIGFLSPQSSILYNQWNCMDWGCFSGVHFEKGKLFGNEKKEIFIKVL